MTARLLDDAVLAADDDTHPAQIAYLGAAHDERIDVESAPGEDPRHAREHAGLVLHETVQHVPVWGKEWSESFAPPKIRHIIGERQQPRKKI